jgi:hypothetical protein
MSDMATALALVPADITVDELDATGSKFVPGDTPSVRVYDDYLAIRYKGKWYVISRWKPDGSERFGKYMSLVRFAQEQHVAAGGKIRKLPPRKKAARSHSVHHKASPKTHDTRNLNKMFKSLRALPDDDRQMLRTLTGTLITARMSGVKNFTEKHPLPTHALYTILKLAFEGLGIDIREVVPQIDFDVAFG